MPHIFASDNASLSAEALVGMAREAVLATADGRCTATAWEAESLVRRFGPALAGEVEMVPRTVARSTAGETWRVDCLQCGETCAEVTFRYEAMSGPAQSAPRQSAPRDETALSHAGTQPGADNAVANTPRDANTSEDLSGARGRAEPDERILRAALEVISRKGFKGASMREIAQAAGMPVGSVYLRIKRKEDLLVMVTDQCMAELFDAFERQRDADGPAPERLEDAIRAYLAYISRNRRYINLVYRETRALPPDKRREIFAIERRFTRHWQTIIERGIAEGSLTATDPELSAHAVYFLCTAWSLRYWALDAWSEADVAHSLIELVLEGLGRLPDAEAMEETA